MGERRPSDLATRCEIGEKQVKLSGPCRVIGAIKRVGQCSDDAVMLHPDEKRRPATISNGRHHPPSDWRWECGSTVLAATGDAEQPGHTQRFEVTRRNQAGLIDALSIRRKHIIGDLLRHINHACIDHRVVVHKISVAEWLWPFGRV